MRFLSPRPFHRLVFVLVLAVLFAAQLAAAQSSPPNRKPPPPPPPPAATDQQQFVSYWHSTAQSHYAFYSISLNSSSNNPGDFLEQKIAPPGANLNTFGTDSTSGINNRLSTVTSDSQVEPYPVNYSEANVSLGNINYAPYAPCP